MHYHFFFLFFFRLQNFIKLEEIQDLSSKSTCELGDLEPNYREAREFILMLHKESLMMWTLRLIKLLNQLYKQINLLLIPTCPSIFGWEATCTWRQNNSHHKFWTSQRLQPFTSPTSTWPHRMPLIFPSIYVIATLGVNSSMPDQVLISILEASNFNLNRQVYFTPTHTSHCLRHQWAHMHWWDLPRGGEGEPTQIPLRN